MSGYDRNTGIFELTHTKANYWLRRTEFPPSCNGKHGMELYAALLLDAGHEVLVVHLNWLRVKATPEQVWEALSGIRSDPSRAAHYYRHGASIPPSTAKPEKSSGIKLLSAEAVGTLRQGTDGRGKKAGEEVASGLSKCRACGTKIAKGELCITGYFDFQGDGQYLTKCFAHRECPATNPHP